MSSVVPLVCLGLIREYLGYRTQRAEIYDGLLTIARSTAMAVERDLQLRISSLETLAMSTTLLENDLGPFDRQAETFLTRLPAGTLLGIATPDMRVQRLYGMPGGVTVDPPQPEPPLDGHSVFDAAQPVVTDLQRFGSTDALWRFGVDVPVIRNGRVVYDLFIRLSASAITSLIHRQYLPAQSVLTDVDPKGMVIGRIPSAERFVGSPIVPSLWSNVQAHAEGIVHAPTLEGTPAVAAHTRITAVQLDSGGRFGGKRSVRAHARRRSSALA